MDKIEWGEPIRVDGVRPGWLSDDQVIAFENYPDRWLGLDRRNTAGWYEWAENGVGMACPIHIRLPADHPHYAKPVPQWAASRVYDLAGKIGGSDYHAKVVHAFARYIAEHEEAPKDKATLLAEELYQAAYPQSEGLPEDWLRDAWMRVANHLIHKGKESGE